jgi:hypothetical protein
MGPDDPKKLKQMRPEEINTCSLEEVKTVHFTICQKPWSCRTHNDGNCPGLHKKWWAVRYKTERALFPGREIEEKPCTHAGIPYKPIGIAA